MTYRQEYYEGEAEDAAEMLGLDEWVEVPFGRFRNVLMTKDYTPLEPGVLEHKFYAKGVGPVLVVGISGGSDREELLRFTRGPAALRGPAPHAAWPRAGTEGERCRSEPSRSPRAVADSAFPSGSSCPAQRA